MVAFILRRIFSTLAVAFGSTVALFVVTHVIPSDPAIAMLSDKAPSEVLEAFRHRWGLDRSLPEQYGIYISQLIRGDLGVSIRTGHPIAEDIAAHMPATVELAIAAMFLSTVGGIVLGTFAALARNSSTDVVIRVVSLAGVSAPVFWTGVMLIFIFFYLLNWFPAGGRLSLLLDPPRHVTGLYTIDAILMGNWATFSDSLRHLALPATSLGAYYMALFVRLVRSGLIEESHKEYVRTARAKGLNTTQLLYRHIMKNAVNPILSYGGVVFGALLSGAIVTETIFSWPGLGRYAFENALTLDFPAIMAVTLIVGLIYVAVNLVVDVLQLFLDPRLRTAGDRI